MAKAKPVETPAEGQEVSQPTVETVAPTDLTNGFFDGVVSGTTHELPNGISVTHY